MKAKLSSSLARCGSKGTPRDMGPGPGNHNLQLARHQAQCRICRHPDREAIELDFLGWFGPRELVQNYKLAGESAIYRHAHALGLFDRRRANLLGALDRIIERGGEVNPTAGAVVSAIRLSAQLMREAAAPSGPSTNRIVLAFDGMPQSDAVGPRLHADRKNRPDAAVPAAPENGLPHINPASARRPNHDGDEAAGLRQQPHAAANSVTPVPAPATVPIPSRSGGSPQNAASGDPKAADQPSESGKLASAPSASRPPCPQAPEACTPRVIQQPPHPPQVAGFVWPWPPGKKKIFARRARWCCTGQGPAP